MPDNIPACFRCGGATGSPLPSTVAGPSLTSSIYETRLGIVALTWSRTIVGLSLLAELRLSAAGEKDDADEEEEPPVRFHVRPWFLWMRRGSKRFHLKDHRRHRTLDIAWDLRRASFPPSGGPEPAAGFYVVIAIDGESLMVAGDLADKKIKAKRTSAPFSKSVLISRREHMALRDAAGVVASGIGRRCYRTTARLGGRERELSIELSSQVKERDSIAMSVSVDGERVLHVRRLRWKFRGSEKVELGGAAGRIQISWDLHDLLFQPRTEAAASAGGGAAARSEAEPGHAVLVFRFDREKKGKEETGHSGKGLGGYFGNGQMNKDLMMGYFGKNRNWSESSSGGGGNGEGRSGRQRKSLRKTSSSSSSASSASSSSSSTVMDWASQEEVELQRAEGFSLLVYLWKS